MLGRIFILAMLAGAIFPPSADAQRWRRWNHWPQQQPQFYQPGWRPNPYPQQQAQQPRPAAPEKPQYIPPFVFPQAPSVEPIADDPPIDPNRPYDGSLMMMHLPSDVRAWCRNPDGSCVQCSQVMVGLENNYLNMSSLLWDTEFGRAERGGSYPSRVAAYARKRGMKIYNVTGDTYPWIDFAAKTGRFCAIGAGSAHFQTLYGRDFKNGVWYVCNNNSTNRIDQYDWNSFRRLHHASGEWVVIPDMPACPPPPEYVEWWN